MNNKTGTISICLVDDEIKVLHAMHRVLQISGIGHVNSFTHWQAALEHLSKCKTDLLILDILMPDISGVQALGESKKRWNNMPVVMATGVNDCATAVECMKKGASDYLVKPISGELLIETVKSLLFLSELTRAADMPANPSQHARATETMETCRNRVRSFHPEHIKKTFLTENTTSGLAPQIIDYLCRKDIYSDSGMNARTTAEALNTNTTYLSTTVNSVFGIGFRMLLNNIRLAVLIEALDGGGPGSFSIEGHAASVGFSRAATFYSAFKAALGTTPADFFSFQE